MRRGFIACLASAAIAVAFVYGCGVDTTGTALAPAAPDTSTPDTQPSLPPVADAPVDTYDGFFPDPTPGFDPQHVDKKYLRLAEAVAVDVAPGTTLKIVTSVPPTLDGMPSAALVHDATNDVVVWTVKSLRLQGNAPTTWGRVRVVGPKPIVIVSQGDVTLDGIVSGYSDNSEVGPGAVAAKATQDGAGRSGGGGGGNGVAGGTGGPSAAEPTTPGGEVVAMTTKLQGGVAGGRGGTFGTPCGLGGAGGGAVQISTMGNIVIGGYGGIDVGGGGGRGGCAVAASGAGGGGGGAGGTVQLEAIGTIDLRGFAQIATMGGGGGEGGCATAGAGNDGAAGPFTPSTNLYGAVGGAGGCAGVGGAGAGATGAGPANGAAGGLTYGGGGGGGGHGKVWLRTRGTTPTVATSVIVGTTIPDDTKF